MTTRSPGAIVARSTSTTPIMTSPVVRTRDGSISQPKRRWAKAAKAARMPGSGGVYPVSPCATADCSAAVIGSARGKSISATNIGRTSSG